MWLIQFQTDQGERAVGILENDCESVRVLKDVQTSYALAQDAINQNLSLDDLAEKKSGNQNASYSQIAEDKRLLPPLDHPDPAHCFVTGTGLTHLGSADTRDKMHIKEKEFEENLTDSIKMFRMGLEGGKPPGNQIGVQPEWFYKGDGSCLVPPEGPLPIPSYSLHLGEETEIVSLYIIDGEGNPARLGYSLGNESSDHVMEKQNYLYLAHSKLRHCSIGPVLFTGNIPEDLRGMTRIIRNGKTIWQKEFLSGEKNMTHWLRNLEHHHFKYSMFRRPGDAHVHYFGAATLCFADGVITEPGDQIEIQCDSFGPPLRNRLKLSKAESFQLKQL